MDFSRNIYSNARNPLPREALLDKIHRADIHHPLTPHGSSYIISKGPRSTDRHRHRALPIPHLFPQYQGRIAPPGEHQHRLTATADLALAAWTCHKHHDLQHLLAIRHAEAFIHERSHPLESFCVLDCPNKDDLAGCGGGVGGALEELAHVPDLMGDSDTGGEEDDGAVGVEGIVATVGALDNAGKGDDARGRGSSEVVQFCSHSRAFGDDEVDLGGGAVGVGDVELGVGVREEFFLKGEVGGGS